MTFIIAVLASVAIPNAVSMIDRAALDYETKKFYTDLRFLQSFDRMTNMRDSHFNIAADESVRLIVSPAGYTLKKNSNNLLYDEHNFSYGVTAKKSKIVKFDDMGKITPATSDTLYLVSRRGKKNSIVFDSVGRFRGGLEE